MHWCHRYQFDLRDIEELLFERGVTVTYEAIRCWCDKSGAAFAHRVKAARRKPGSIGTLMRCSLRYAAGLTCCGERLSSTVPNSTSCCKASDPDQTLVGRNFQRIPEVTHVLPMF